MAYTGVKILAAALPVESLRGHPLRYCICCEDIDGKVVWLRAEAGPGKWGPTSLAIRYPTHRDALRVVSRLRLTAKRKIQIVDAPQD